MNEFSSNWVGFRVSRQVLRVYWGGNHQSDLATLEETFKQAERTLGPRGGPRVGQISPQADNKRSPVGLTYYRKRPDIDRLSSSSSNDDEGERGEEMRWDGMG